MLRCVQVHHTMNESMNSHFSFFHDTVKKVVGEKWSFYEKTFITNCFENQRILNFHAHALVYHVIMRSLVFQDHFFTCLPKYGGTWWTRELGLYNYKNNQNYTSRHVHRVPFFSIFKWDHDATIKTIKCDQNCMHRHVLSRFIVFMIQLVFKHIY